MMCRQRGADAKMKVWSINRQGGPLQARYLPKWYRYSYWRLCWQECQLQPSIAASTGTSTGTAAARMHLAH